jgi:hypothetical protein
MKVKKGRGDITVKELTEMLSKLEKEKEMLYVSTI